MSLHVYRSGTWGAICDSSNSIHAYKGGVPNLVKSTDWIYANSQWQNVCPEPSYPFGFDYVNRAVDMIYDGFTPVGMRHTVYHENSTDNYPFGVGYDFIMTCNVDVIVAENEEVYIRAYSPADGYSSPVWTFGPQGQGTYASVKSFSYSAVNYNMKIIGEAGLNSEFQIVTEVLPINEPDPNYLNWSGIPFPFDYDSND